MIMPFDKEYKATKQIMLGNAKVKEEFKPLMEWIDKTFKVKTINIYYDTIDRGTKPRLGIYFETRTESSSFHENGEFTNYDSKKQKRIAEKFKQLMKEQNLLKEGNFFFNFFRNKKTGIYSAENILIYTSAFKPIAKIEANESIPENNIRNLRDELSNRDLWEISRGFSETTFLDRKSVV